MGKSVKTTNRPDSGNLRTGKIMDLNDFLGPNPIVIDLQAENIEKG